MTTKSYALQFDGYWREPNVGSLPEKSGIYGVYACTHDVAGGTVSLRRLLYLGEAADLCSRVCNHEQWRAWRLQLKAGEEVCVSVALISPEGDRQRAEAAMIFKHKPPCNTEHVESFPFDTTSITTAGQNALMSSSFTVQPTEKASGTYGRR
jgi:hypothetical protein